MIEKADSVNALPQVTSGACRHFTASAQSQNGLRFRLILSLCLIVLGLHARHCFAAGVVSGCTEAALRVALASGGSITFTGDCSITLSQQIPIFRPTVIDAQGHNVVISGGSSVSLFDVTTNLTLRGLSLLNGKSTTSGAALHIAPGALVIAENCIFGGNSVVATNGLSGTAGGTNSAATGLDGTDGMNGPAAFGGCIYNSGDLALTRCILTNNSVVAGNGGSGGAGGNGGGPFFVGGNGGNGATGGLALGGAIYNLANATIVNCLFSGNTATGGNGGAGGAGGTGLNPGFDGSGGSGGIGYGGAFYNAQNLTLSGSTFSTNSARGGNSATAGTGGNGTGQNGAKGADASGGALFNAWWAVATNCTFYTNTVFGGAGANGGNGRATFAIPGAGGDGGDAIGGSVGNVNALTIITCTLSGGAGFGGTNGLAGNGKFIESPGNPGIAKGGNIANSGGELSVLGTIVAASISGQNAFGQLTDLGYNLSSDSTSSFVNASLQNTDPKLAPLAFNGGPTPTMALLSGSPAINRIPANLIPPTDQRGFARPFGEFGDIGAFEFGAAVIAPKVSLALTRASNGIVSLATQGTVGANYIVQASTNLVSWQNIATNLAPVQFKDSVTNLSQRFYRLTR